MKTLPLCVLFLVILIIISCDTKNESIVVEKQWIKIEIEGEHAPVYAIYGNIDGSLMVAMYGKILKTDDGGKNWTKKLEVLDDIGSIKMSHDTLLAISNFTDYYSLDQGINWEILAQDLPLNYVETVQTTTGIVYRRQENSNGELGLPTSLFESRDGGHSWKNIFPFQASIYSIYTNEENNLYVGINNTVIWNEERGSFEENLENNSAFYYSKN